MAPPSDFANADLDSLVAQLTNEEARKLTTGVGWWRTAAIPRLGIPAIKLSDGPNGVRGENSYYGSKALSMPCATALGSTWDAELINELGKTIMAPEARLRASSVILAQLSIYNALLWAAVYVARESPYKILKLMLYHQSFESFAEDPHLSGTLAAAYVNSIQNEGISCTIKHFVANDQENNRHGSDSIVTPRALREIYLMPFMIAERDSRPWSYMTSYNKLNGVHCSDNHWLLNDLLRGEWGSKTTVMSDWYGVYSLVKSYKAGLDLEMPGENGLRDARSVDRRLIGYKMQVDDVKACAKRVLQLVQQVAKAAPDVVFGEDKESQTNVTDAQKALLRKAAAQSIVLLRNEGNILPLNKDQVKRVAVIGPNAKQRLITGGGSAEVIPLYVVSPFEGIRDAFGKDKVTWVEGARASKHLDTLNYELTTPDGQDGWRLEFYAHDAKDTRVKLYSMQVPNLTEQFSLKAKGVLRPQEVSSEWEFGLIVVGRGRLYIDGNLVADNWENQTYGATFYSQGTIEVTGRYYIEKGKTYNIEVIYNNIYPLRGNAIADMRALRLGGSPVFDEEKELQAAEKAAKEADVAVVVIGLNHDWESEGHDRTNLELPGRTNELVERVLKANPRTIVVNQSGSAVEMPWADKVPAIMQAWYAGNSAGDALAEVLTGVVNPSAKLSITFPRSLSDVPSHGHFGSTLGPVRYAEDLWVGYKHYIDRNITPLYPFGYGLSYTTFSYSDLTISTSKVSATDASKVHVSVSVKVTNTGSRTGSEVVQVFVSPPAHSRLEPSPSCVLKGFARVKDLAAGASAEAKVVLDKYAFSLWEEAASKWLVAKGVHTVLVAASSVDIKLRGDVAVENDIHWVGL
ncbi:beta-glucosidase [Auriculariales sp. MPI-PUGE-AT-0066]|nr:beta-glucosidase [Auriculariales sp. MPI-PUGE-AT-0066]